MALMVSAIDSMQSMRMRINESGQGLSASPSGSHCVVLSGHDTKPPHCLSVDLGV